MTTLDHSTRFAAFPPEVVARIDRAVGDGAVVVESEPVVRDFRLVPATAVAAVSARLRELWASAPAPGRIVWSLAGSADAGLDDIELAALLGRLMHVEAVYQAITGSEKQVVAIGTLRDEYVGVSVVVPSSGSAAQAITLLDSLAPLAPVAFVAAATATALAGSSDGREAVRRFRSAGGEIGLLVPRAETSAALQDPASQVVALVQLLDGPPAIGRFEDIAAVDAAALHAFMRQAGLRADASQFVPAADAPAESIARSGPYTRGAPYVPQPFDLRVPLARATAADWFELPAIAASVIPPGAWWQQQTGPADEAMAALLDSSRMEVHFRLGRVSYAELRRYPEVRVYNWPAPAPASRVTLFDCAPDELAGVADAIARVAQDAGPRLRRVPAAELLRRAADEVLARFNTSSAAAIDLQNEVHDYLAEVPQDAPLRGDYADFARFAPTALGDALELGSGYGHLAWALASRARRYTRLDLDARMFATLRPDLHQSGAVADMHRLPFAAASFDTVLANNVLEHLYDPLTGLQEAHRVLRPGGRLVALVPLDALNNRHELPAHHWKIDEPGLRAALTMAGFEITRLEIVSLYDFGVTGAFPCQLGLAANFEAMVPRPGERQQAATTERRSFTWPAEPGLAGRLLPVVCELTAFERWSGRDVLAVGSDATDVEEFARFGARVTAIAPSSLPWAAADASVDLVYAFLTLPCAPLAAMAAEIRRVLKPGGAVVAGFRNRNGLRYQARVQSYFGEACDLRAFADADGLVRLGDDDGARFDEQYVLAGDVEAAFTGFAQKTVAVRNLTPDDLPAVPPAGYEPAFWQWLSTTHGRYVLLRAEK